MYRSDGNIIYCGRKDRQIKLRGQRIELSEIEDVINKCVGVDRSAVLIRNFHDAPAIIAFVQFTGTLDKEGLEDGKEALKMHVSQRLPRFMYPSLIAALPTLPTSSSGKVNRRELMEMDLQPFFDVSADVGLPQSDVETGLHKIFAELLRADPESFGVTHDLFSIGMNSLLAVQAAGVVSQTFNVNIGLNNIYLRPTIRELGNLIIDAMGQDQRQLMQAEDSASDFLIEFLPVKKKGIHPRVFLIHDVTGMATPFMRLGAYVSNEMWAIGDRDFGKETGFKSIEAMADHYITHIQGIQPTGPYVIAGYSMGGLVALSMSDKLKKAGESVARLILFDTIFTPTSEREGIKASDWTARAIDRILSDFPEVGGKWKERLATEIRKNMDFTWDFEPPHYDGPTTLIVPKDRSWYRSGHASDFDSGIDDRNGWDHRLSNMEMRFSEEGTIRCSCPRTSNRWRKF
jgi:pimeloyl-ACP methyl ester carboxylesterase